MIYLSDVRVYVVFTLYVNNKQSTPWINMMKRIATLEFIIKILLKYTHILVNLSWYQKQWIHLKASGVDELNLIRLLTFLSLSENLSEYLIMLKHSSSVNPFNLISHGTEKSLLLKLSLKMLDLEKTMWTSSLSSFL